MHKQLLAAVQAQVLHLLHLTDNLLTEQSVLAGLTQAAGSSRHHNLQSLTGGTLSGL
jgi:hypothetical protein